MNLNRLLKGTAIYLILGHATLGRRFRNFSVSLEMNMGSTNQGVVPPSLLSTLNRSGINSRKTVLISFGELGIMMSKMHESDLYQV